MQSHTQKALADIKEILDKHGVDNTKPFNDLTANHECVAGWEVERNGLVLIYGKTDENLPIICIYDGVDLIIEISEKKDEYGSINSPSEWSYVVSTDAPKSFSYFKNRQGGPSGDDEFVVLPIEGRDKAFDLIDRLVRAFMNHNV